MLDCRGSVLLLQELGSNFDSGCTDSSTRVTYDSRLTLTLLSVPVAVLINQHYSLSLAVTRTRYSLLDNEHIWYVFKLVAQDHISELFYFCNIIYYMTGSSLCYGNISNKRFHGIFFNQ